MKRALALMLLGGCRTAPAAVAEPEVVPAASTRVPDDAPAVDATGPAGGFVVFGADDSYVIPLDPGAQMQLYPGLFVGGPSADADVLVTLTLEDDDTSDVLRLPYCIDAIEEQTCGHVGDLVDATVQIRQGRAGVGVDCECIAVEGLSDDGHERYVEGLKESLGIEDEELEFMEFGLEEYVEACYEDDRDLPRVAISGGVVHGHDMISAMECGGTNVYSLHWQAEVFRDGVTWESLELGPDFQCFGEIDPSVVTELDFADEEGCRYGEDDCCPEAGEGEARMIVSGFVYDYAGDVSPVGEECGCVRRASVSIDRCASPYDPCGSGEGFGGLSGSSGWWASSNGEAALAVFESGEWQVFVRGRTEALRVEDLGLEATDVLGVEFVPAVPRDVPDFPLTAAANVPSSDAVPAKSWGNACFKRFKEGELDAAEAACVEGLLENVESGDDKARGALLYSLGRVEEARGHAERARLAYRRSLKLRPGNVAVQKRLEAL